MIQFEKKPIKIGNNWGFTIPKDVVKKLKLEDKEKVAVEVEIDHTEAGHDMSVKFNWITDIEKIGDSFAFRITQKTEGEILGKLLTSYDTKKIMRAYKVGIRSYHLCACPVCGNKHEKGGEKQ